MNKEVIELYPKNVWKHFESINEIPRGSKKEERIIAFMKSFGENLGLDTSVDATGNVLIRKPATAGYENRKGVVLQSHLDMVHQKNSDSDFDFDNQGIQSYIDDGWLKAKGTTLGADNGMGVASIMSVLADDTIEHGPIEAFFTIDEETGMTGAFGLEGGLLNGDILLNLDSEDEGELYIGCAGGIDATIKDEYSQVDVDNGKSAVKINLRGLKGGHSGMDIILGRGNANKLMNRLLIELVKKYSIGLSKFDGGSLRNALPREASSIIIFNDKDRSALQEHIKNYGNTLKDEFGDIEPALVFSTEDVALPEQALAEDYLQKVLWAIDASPNGVVAMSKDIEGLTETSTNMARVLIENGELTIMFLSRSSVDSRKEALSQQIESVYSLMNVKSIEHHGSYPGWEPNPNSAILKTMQDGYERLYSKVPKVMAIHAGLECGILGQNYPEMDMISFGPTIRNPHSPDEKVNIETVGKFWDYLLDTLKNVPVKN